MWSPSKSRLPLVLAGLIGCSLFGFGVGVRGALQRPGPTPTADAATGATVAAPSKEAVPLGAPLVEAERPKPQAKTEEETPQTETAQTAQIETPTPVAKAPPPSAAQARSADPLGDALESATAAQAPTSTPAPTVPY